MRQSDLLDDGTRLISILVAILPVAECRVTNHQRSQHVFQYREFWQQMVELKDKSKNAISKHVSSRLWEVVDSQSFCRVSTGTFAPQADFTDAGLIQQSH